MFNKGKMKKKKSKVKQQNNFKTKNKKAFVSKCNNLSHKNRNEEIISLNSSSEQNSQTIEDLYESESEVNYFDSFEEFDDDDSFNDSFEMFNPLTLFNPRKNILHCKSNDNSKKNKSSNITVMTQSYTSTINYKNGKPQKEIYKTHSIKQIDHEGHCIHEKQEAYQNTGTGIEKASKLRELDGKGQKIIKKRNIFTGDQEHNNILNGINEEDLEEFDTQYNKHKEKSKIQNHIEKFLGNKRINTNKKLNNDKNNLLLLPSNES